MSDIRPPEIELEKEIEIKREREIKREIEKGRFARAYGRYQNVFLTDEELADLQASFPTVWGQYIEKLSEYMASTGKRYQSHAATIRRWAGEDAKKAAPPTRNRDYSVKEDEKMCIRDSTCTEAQRRRFLLYALEGLSLAEIGVLCGCSKVAVYQSVEAVRKKFINFLDVYKRQGAVFSAPLRRKAANSSGFMFMLRTS